MLNFYHVTTKTFHNGTYIGEQVATTLCEETPHDATIHLDWDNLSDFYQDNALSCCFNIWNFGRGRRVSFFTDHLFPRKNEWDIKEWTGNPLNIVIETSYDKFSPSIAEVFKWHDLDKAILYLKQHGAEDYFSEKNMMANK